MKIYPKIKEGGRGDGFLNGWSRSNKINNSAKSRMKHFLMVLRVGNESGEKAFFIF